MSEHKDLMLKLKYINEMMGCSCFPDLLSFKIFPDGKEITESCGAYNFFRNPQKEHFELGDPSVSVIVVGDGCTPRTASLFAFRSAWTCISIDPNLKWKNRGRVSRLFCIQKKVEDVKSFHFDKLVLIHVHSHARLEDSVSKFTANKRIVLSMPCCVAQIRERTPDHSYIDNSVWSPHNKIDVWFDYDR